MNTITIGRANDNTIIVPENYTMVSNHHAILIRNDDGSYTFRDTSSNGTLINGQLIKGGAANVGKEDEIILAEQFRFQWTNIGENIGVEEKPNWFDRLIGLNEAPRRHVIVNVFLILGMLWSLFLSAGGIRTSVTAAHLGDFEIVFFIAPSILFLTGYILLFKNLKLGFWCIMAIPVSIIIYGIVGKGMFLDELWHDPWWQEHGAVALLFSEAAFIYMALTFVFYIMPVLTTYCILKIKKNGVSAWKLLKKIKKQ
ncbi:MAG: FHA domain-containing protein [Bacteroidales bacterium]|nr:FHA domain-containing protein [Bacteroidales bacterium]